MATSNDIKVLTLELLKQKTDRDTQRKIGASNMSDPCTRHLAMAMLNEPESESKYWMGGKIGTAIHALIERNIDSSDNVIFDDCMVERKIVLGEIPGYGVVNSKPDLVLPSIKHLIDWKTTTRKKIKKLKDFADGIKQDPESEYTLMKYLGQACLYGWGLSHDGIEVDNISIVFINRDGTSDDDVWVYTVQYDEEIALALWNRANALWAELEDGAHPMNYSTHEHCFKCSSR
jgi:hypothetical protein